MPMIPMNKRTLVAAIGLSLLSGAALAGEGEGWLQRLGNQLFAEQTTLEQSLDKQQALDADTQARLDQREYYRRMRVMHREAVFLSELNLAWIQDQLAHWDCRLAEAQQAEVAERRAELIGARQQLASLCTGLSARDQHQQAVCAQQGTELTNTLAHLDELAGRYASACNDTAPAAPRFEPQSTIPLTGDTPWQR